MFPSGSKLEVANFLLLICTWIILWSGVSCRDYFNGGRKTLEVAPFAKLQNDVEQRLTIPSPVCRLVHKEGHLKDCFGVLLSSSWLLTASSCAPRVKDNSNNHVRVVCGTPSSSSAFTHNEFNVVEIKPLRNATAGERQAPGISLLKLNVDAPGPYVNFEESDGPDFYILEQSKLMKTFFNISGLRIEQTQGFWQKSNNALGLPLILNSSAMRNDDRAENSAHQITTCCLATACQLFKDGITRCNFSRITPTEHKSICRTTETCNEVSSPSSMTPSFHRSLTASKNEETCPEGSDLTSIRNCRPVPPFLKPCCSDETLTQLKVSNPQRKDFKTMVMSNNASVLEEWILCSYFNVSKRDSKNDTLLHNAAYNNSQEAAKVLCDLQIDTEVKNANGDTALIAAAKNSSLDVMKVILNSCKNVNVSATDNAIKTALHYAVEKNSRKMAQVLCDAHIDTEIKNQGGRTVLLVAAYNNRTEVLKVIVNSCVNVNLNAKGNEGKTALHYAAKKNFSKIAEVLCSANISANIKNNQNKTPLVVAAKNNNPEPLKVILNSCANVNVNATDKDNKTALHYATKKCNYEMAQLLVNHHANCSIVDKNGNTPDELIPSPSASCQNDTIVRLRNLFPNERNQTVGQAT